MRTTGWIAALVLALGCTMSEAASRLGYDPQADPFEQYHDAVALAGAENKLVLLVAGGDWCRWCHVLERFMKRNTDVREALESAFVVVKVYVGDENFNEDFFSQLPAARGAPHFWIVSPEREVLASQSTGSLERGLDGYDRGGFFDFIDRWKRPAGEGGEVRQASRPVRRAEPGG